MSKLNSKWLNIENPRIWVVIGIGVAGIVILAESQRRKMKAKKMIIKEDFGVFIERFELLPFPQPPPPAARLLLSGLTFAVKDVFDVKDHVTGFGNPDWKNTHEAADKTALVVTNLLKNGATCVGKTVMDELSFGITGENVHYGTPTNPKLPSHIPGGSSSGSAVAVAAKLADFALGTDIIGCIRIPAAYCGVMGFRPSHGVVSSIGVISSSQSLETVGLFTRDPSVMHLAGHVLLNLKQVEIRRTRRCIIADDLFQLSKVPKQNILSVVCKVIKDLKGYQLPEHMNFSQYIAANVPSLKDFQEESTKLQNGLSALKALCAVMFSLLRHEFKSNHHDWVESVEPKVGPGVSSRVLEALTTTHDNVKTFYKVRTEMRAALRSLLKDDGILIIPTVADPPLRLNSKKGVSSEFHARAFPLLSIASMSGCCQVTAPIGNHNDYPMSVSLIASHGADKFLLDTVLDMYTSLQDQASIVSHSVPLPDVNGDMDASDLLKEKGNAAYKKKEWNRAVSYYTEAIKLNEVNATLYSNRAAAYLELGCFQEAEEDCSKAISLDKKNVKAYMRRGTARESLLFVKEALQDFKHVCVLEPQNKTASDAEKRLRKMMS